VKWAGGKRNIINELRDRLPKRFNAYYEPFLGGGAFFFEICTHFLDNAFLSDINLELILAFNVIKRDPEPLISLLEDHALKHSNDYYYRIREQHDLQDPVKIAARFIYLNKICYNGLYRVNKKGYFNVPVGRYTNPTIFRRDNLVACSKALENVCIEFRAFDTVKPQTGDFVYCDPPYYPLDKTSRFTNYTGANFNEEDQLRLRNFAHTLHQSGVFVMLSNSDTEFIRDLYAASPFSINMVESPRYINCKPGKRNPVNELIITTY